jgi:hypothetical protein
VNLAAALPGALAAPLRPVAYGKCAIDVGVGQASGNRPRYAVASLSFDSGTSPSTVMLNPFSDGTSQAFSFFVSSSFSTGASGDSEAVEQSARPIHTNEIEPTGSKSNSQ